MVAAVKTDLSTEAKRLITKICELEAKTNRLFGSFLKSAKDTGLLLIALAKETGKDNQELYKLVRDNSPRPPSERTLWLYKQIASNWDFVAEFAGGEEFLLAMSVTDFMALLGRLKNPNKKPKKVTTDPLPGADVLKPGASPVDATVTTSPNAAGMADAAAAAPGAFHQGEGAEPETDVEWLHAAATALKSALEAVTTDKAAAKSIMVNEVLELIAKLRKKLGIK